MVSAWRGQLGDLVAHTDPGAGRGSRILQSHLLGTKNDGDAVTVDQASGLWLEVKMVSLMPKLHATDLTGSCCSGFPRSPEMVQFLVAFPASMLSRKRDVNWSLFSYCSVSLSPRILIWKWPIWASFNPFLSVQSTLLLSPLGSLFSVIEWGRIPSWNCK